MKKTVIVRVPATTANCGPGFDAVGIACTLYNHLELTINESGNIQITNIGEGSDLLPTDATNITYQAVQSVFAKVGYTCPGLSLTMTNTIPLARGLGSSAAAIVAGLFAANEILGSPLTQEELLDMATAVEGHPDNVAPALYGGIAISAMNNAKVETLRLLPPRPLSLVVAVPAFALATKTARRVLPKQVSLADAVFNVSRTALMVGALATGNYTYLSTGLEDKLHQPYRQSLIPGMPDVLAAAKTAGAFGAALSGAGPCLIAFTETQADAIGQAMVEAFAHHQVEAKYLTLSIDTEGAKKLS
ncbi:homoserine kinase [Anaerosporomusa subterranea]|uniref:Homoserine kinase n=1 Tax=Anaerosporomusa subterranea TaxID=1794912 RepID=A0A154BVE3_ANASB|nr:homoserine kinase [Anaerosporomusa subterranea]KYZ77458.1 homoserine kinase [Anaerosporomusa subterranea]